MGKRRPIPSFPSADMLAPRKGGGMAINGWLVADSDMHVMEPADLWQRYMDPSWGLLTPIGLEDSDRDMRVKLKSVIQPQRGAAAAAGNPYNPTQEAALRQPFLGAAPA